MDVLRVIGDSLYKVFISLWDVKVPFLGNAALLSFLLFPVVVGYLIDFLLSVFGNKKGGDS